jgi:hypothetical protein
VTWGAGRLCSGSSWKFCTQSATISGVIGVRGVIFLFSSLDKKARYSSLRRAPCRFATRKNSIDLMNVCVTIS